MSTLSYAKIWTADERDDQTEKLTGVAHNVKYDSWIKQSVCVGIERETRFRPAHTHQSKLNKSDTVADFAKSHQSGRREISTGDLSIAKAARPIHF